MHDALHTLLQKNDPPSPGWRVSERERERERESEREKKKRRNKAFLCQAKIERQ